MPVQGEKEGELPEFKKLTDTRKAQVLIGGYWEDMPFMMLDAGDVFRLFEEDGSDVDGGQVCIAQGCATREPDGLGRVACIPAGRGVTARVRFSKEGA